MIIGSGDIALTLSRKSNTFKCVMNNSFEVTGLRYQLLSVSVMEKLGIETSFDDDVVTLVNQ